MKGIFTGLFLISGVAFANVSIEGNYTCQGHDLFLNKDYTHGLLNIKKNGEAYNLKFNNDEDTSSEIGTGVWDEQHSVLSVIYKDDKGSNRLGVQSYSLSEDGKSLSGPWTNLGESKVGTETCTLLK